MTMVKKLKNSPFNEFIKIHLAITKNMFLATENKNRNYQYNPIYQRSSYQQPITMSSL